MLSSSPPALPVTAAAWIALGALAVVTARVLRPASGTGETASPTRRALAALRSRRSTRLALVTLVVLAAAALFARWLAPYDPRIALDLAHGANLPPSLAHPFGTDQFSRDALSRVLYGARASLGVAVFSALVAASLGTLYGAAAAFVGGSIDALMMRVVDAALSVPRVLLLIVVVALWGKLTLVGLVLLLGLTTWMDVSRLVRAEVLSLRRRDFVDAAEALGASRVRVLLRHLLPNALTPAVVAATLGVGSAIAAEAGLSYLGLGVQPPEPSWGNIVGDGASELLTRWWLSLFAGLAVVITAVAVNVVGDALRDALDPRDLPRR
jgi:peptide/nickel transport system permease protein